MPKNDLIMSKYQALLLKLSEYINDTLLFHSLKYLNTSEIKSFFGMYFLQNFDNHLETTIMLLNEYNIKLDDKIVFKINHILFNYTDFLNNI